MRSDPTVVSDQNLFFGGDERIRVIWVGGDTYFCNYSMTAVCSDPVGDWTS